MSIQLSICIPIYNCAEFVGQALDSVLSQINDEVEIVIYDGGSTDKTPELMEGFAKKWPNLHYHRGSARGGIDLDMATCVGLAKGEYCWLFSGDDVMRPGAIQKALESIRLGYDILICKHTICSKTMVISHEHPVLMPDQIFTVNFANVNERLAWFRCAVTTEAFFSFMSGLIIRRQKWESGSLPKAFNKSCWGHVARFFELISSGLKVCYLAEIWLDQRSGNDSFADKGVVNRYRISIEGYHRLADSYFGHNSLEAFHIRRVIRNEYSLIVFLRAKICCFFYPERESKYILDGLFKMAYSDQSLDMYVKRTIFFGTQYWLINTARFFYQPIKLMRRVFKNV